MGCCASKEPSGAAAPASAEESAEGLSTRLLQAASGDYTAVAPSLGSGNPLEAGASGGASVREVVASHAAHSTVLAGQALLQVAQNIPLVAPLAFLVGAVASSASESVELKADCQEFQQVVTMLERILVKAEHLAEHADEIDEIRETLEEALSLMDSIKSKGILEVFCKVETTRSKFEELRDRINRAIQRLNLATGVEANSIARAQFRQAKELNRIVNDMGGPQAVMDDPEKLRQVQERMSAAEKVLIAQMQAQRVELKGVKAAVKTAVTAIGTVHSSQKDHFELSAAQKEQMTVQFMQLQKENEEQRMQAEVLQTQVGELKDMLSELKNAMQLFPTPAAEPKRLAVMNQGGFLDVAPADGGDDVFQVMQAACEAAGKRWEVLSIVQLVGQRKNVTGAGYVPPSFAAGPLAVATEAAAAGGGPSACPGEDLCGLSMPRKASMCQHVVKSGVGLQMVGRSDGPELAAPEQLAVAARTDPVVEQFLADLGNAMAGGAPAIWQQREGGQAAANTLFSTVFLQLLGPEFADTLLYAGTPLRVEGQTMGTLCCLAPRPPEGGVDMAELAELARPIEAALERRLARKRQEAANAAMMQQLQQMQAMQMQQMQMQMASLGQQMLASPAASGQLLQPPSPMMMAPPMAMASPAASGQLLQPPSPMMMAPPMAMAGQPPMPMMPSPLAMPAAQPPGAFPPAPAGGGG